MLLRLRGEAFWVGRGVHSALLDYVHHKLDRTFSRSIGGGGCGVAFKPSWLRLFYVVIHISSVPFSDEIADCYIRL